MSNEFIQIMKREVIFLGDIHGAFSYIKKQVERQQMSDCIIIQVGDFGIGYYNEEKDIKLLLDLNVFLGERNIELLAIRGNHDNPKYFKGNHLYDNIKLLEDYTVLDINERRFLFVGGAISIDRKSSLNEMQSQARVGNKIERYWFDEFFKFDFDKIQNLEGINVVVTHTSPSFVYPDNSIAFGYMVENFSQYDDELKNDLNRERKDVSQMFNMLNESGKNDIRVHAYGHFHSTQQTVVGNCTHHLLDINEFKML